MEFKTLALGAIAGVSMTMTTLAPALQPAIALGSHSHPTATPIVCDECDALAASGGFSRIVSVPQQGLQLQFGETQIKCTGTYVGARIDAQPGSNSWSVNMQSQGGSPFFVTEFVNSTGRHFTPELSSYSNSNGNIKATFNGPALGFPNFTALYIYDNGLGEIGFVKPDTPVPQGFTDTIDLSSNGVLVNNAYPLAHMISAVEDCSGIFSNGNNTK